LDNELLKGLLDKNQIGSNSDYGLLHSFTELYGEKITGKLITALNKLFLNYMQIHGFTCGLDDLLLKKKINKMRTELLEQAHQETVKEVCKTYNINPPKDVNYFGRSAFRCDS
jgi:DNA-directed RNA polymerase I subunit RPA1